ncbi:MAG: enoyl-CoA hydratase/isomerase family protein [Proteobacteria bacterium]|nr:MAG: enoyl-CoA hydratase/isomerase family protein [Pseudomonadota bacterium]
MKYEAIKFDRRGAVAWITLYRPQVLNALSPNLIDELGRAIALAEDDPAIRVLVITGSPPAFCAGADLKFIGSGIGESLGDGLASFLELLGSVFNALERSMLPTIAAVNGLALAGGLELVLCCDLVIAADSATLGDAHANYGLIPGGGSSIRLPRKIGPTRAKYLLYTGESLAASDLIDCGLVNRVVPDNALRSTVQEIAETIAAKSPLAIRRVKQLVNDAIDQPLLSALRQEINVGIVHTQSQDMREGLAAFKEKRKPKFVGR